MPLHAPPPVVLAALARKYRALGDLRRARAAGDDAAPRAVLRPVAQEFPGALRELDALPLDVIDARAEALEAAARGGDVAPWMAWLGHYHALFRAALRVKLRAARGRGDAALLAALAREATAEAGVALDAAFVRAVADPPGGRLSALVLARLGALHGEAPAVIAAALFPTGRPRAIGPER